MGSQRLSWKKYLPVALWLCSLLPQGSCSWSPAGLQHAGQRNWCSYVVTRTVSCHVQNGTFLQRVFQGCRWPGGCSGGSYRALVRPAYKVAYKTVTALEWKCCPGRSGLSCGEDPSPRLRHALPGGRTDPAHLPAHSTGRAAPWDATLSSLSGPHTPPCPTSFSNAPVHHLPLLPSPWGAAPVPSSTPGLPPRCPLHCSCPHSCSRTHPGVHCPVRPPIPSCFPIHCLTHTGAQQSSL